MADSEFHERSQLFISEHNETLSAAAMGFSNPDCVYVPPLQNSKGLASIVM